MPRDKLTPKQEKFVKAYTETGNATQSALLTYNTNDPVTAGAIGYENLNKPQVAAAIEREKRQMADILRPERIISEMEADKRKQREEGHWNGVNKIHELMGRAAGLWDGDKDQEGRIVVNIDLG